MDSSRENRRPEITPPDDWGFAFIWGGESNREVLEWEKRCPFYSLFLFLNKLWAFLVAVLSKTNKPPNSHFLAKK